METLPQRLTAFYQAMNEGRAVLDRVDSIYAPNIHYVDPLQEVRDRAGIRESFEKMFKKYTVGLHHVEMIGDERLVMGTWRMDLTPLIGPTFKIHGACRFEAEGGLVVRQRDYWDLLGTAMDTLPWVEPIYQRIVEALFL